MSLLEKYTPQINYKKTPGAFTEETGNKLAKHVISMSADSNSFCVFLPGEKELPPTNNFTELIRRANSSSLLRADLNQPVTRMFFEVLESTPDSIEDFCANHVPPLEVDFFQGRYENMPKDVLEKLDNLDVVPERPVCYRFKVAGISTPSNE